LIELTAGAARATILPDVGATFTRLAVAERDILVPAPAGADPNRGFHGSFLMAPWTNRLDGGRIMLAGIEHRMPVNRPAEGTALHGFLRELAWQVRQADAAVAELACSFERGPFLGAALLRARLAEDHLALTVSLTNRAELPTPMGFGWHPYFPRPAGTRLSAAARTVFGRDSRNLPIAARPSAGIQGSDAVLDGLDTHFAAWGGTAMLDWPDGRGLTLHTSGAWASNLQVFAPRQAGVIAVEPVSHAPDAANRPAAAAHGAMHVLPPGAALEASLTIHWR
jgi:aldose 1-epimerase